jgi:hypothetical protein
LYGPGEGLGGPGRRCCAFGSFGLFVVPLIHTPGARRRIQPGYEELP